MRKIIVRNFALNHISKVYGKTVNWVRASNWSIPSICIGGLYSIYSDSNFLSPLGILILLVIFSQLLISFVYFRYKPVKWDELDDVQKWQYGKAYFSGQLTRTLPKDEVDKIASEWDEVNGKFIESMKDKKFYNISTFLVNPVTMLITAIIASLM